MFRLSNYVTKKMVQYIEKNLVRIPSNQFRITHGYQNRKCHWQSYTEYLLNNKNKIIIALLVSKERDEVILHFINYSEETKEYYDLTLGKLLTTEYEVYYWKQYEPSSENERMGLVLKNSKEIFFEESITNSIVAFLFRKQKCNLI